MLLYYYKEKTGVWVVKKIFIILGKTILYVLLAIFVFYLVTIIHGFITGFPIEEL